MTAKLTSFSYNVGTIYNCFFFFLTGMFINPPTAPSTPSLHHRVAGSKKSPVWIGIFNSVFLEHLETAVEVKFDNSATSYFHLVAWPSLVLSFEYFPCFLRRKLLQKAWRYFVKRLAYTIALRRDFKKSRLPDISCPISKLTEGASVLALEIPVLHMTAEGIAHMISTARRNLQTLTRLVNYLFCITCSLENNAFSVLHYIIKVTLHYYMLHRFKNHSSLERSLTSLLDLIRLYSILAELLALAKRPQSGAPWVRKFGKLSIWENLVMT